MKTIFFETASWEKRLLEKSFPQAIFVKEPLTEDNVNQYVNVQIISTFIYSKLDKNVLKKLPQLEFIATRSTGFDHIDTVFAKEKKILVANVPEYGSRTVAEHTFALILSLTRKIYQSIRQVKEFEFNRKDIRGVDLFGKTLGIVGLGKIGQEVLKIARGFGMNIIVNNRSHNEILAQEWQFKYVDLPTLLSKADVVTLHLPHTKETHHLINKKNINDFKKGSFLINTSRGGLIETEALILGLENNILSGVGLDVLENEKELNEEAEILTSDFNKKSNLKTLVLEHILINNPKVIITPHNAFNSKEALNRITLTTIKNIDSFLKKSPIDLVNS